MFRPYKWAIIRLLVEPKRRLYNKGLRGGRDLLLHYLVADKLAKEAAQEDERNIVYDRIPISTIATRIKEEGLKNGKHNGKGRRKERYADLFSQR
jgi:hypothetical protein